MKKVLFLAFMLLSLSVWAGKPHRVYCELIGKMTSPSSEDMEVFLDFGKSAYRSKLFYDEWGISHTFRTMVQAMNFLSKRGWELESTYSLTIAKAFIFEQHWVLSKEVKDKIKVKEGLNLANKKKKK